MISAVTTLFFFVLATYKLKRMKAIQTLSYQLNKTSKRKKEIAKKEEKKKVDKRLKEKKIEAFNYRINAT